MLGDQANRRPVAAPQDTQQEMLTADLVVLVRQRFSKRQLQDLLCAVTERHTTSRPPASTRARQGVVKSVGAESAGYAVANRTQVNADGAHRVGLLVEIRVSRSG